MADNKAKRGGADRRRISTGEAYEVTYFQRKHGLDREAALRIIKDAKGDRDKANAAASGAKK
jgi:hypothetical protein